MGGAVVGNTVDRRLGAPVGAADAEVTYGCYALPNKALAALPGVTHVYAWPGSGYSGTQFLVGCLIHDELDDGTTEAILISEYDDGTTHYWQAYSYIVETLATNLIVNTTNTSAAGYFGSPYPQFTRVANVYEISDVTTGTTTIFTINFGGAGNPFAVTTGAQGTFYLTQLPLGVTGLDLNTPYTVTAVGGSSGAWTVSIGTPTTSGTYTSGGGMSILEIPYGPVAVFPSGGPAQAAQGSTAAGQLYMYPNPSDRSTYGAFPMMANPGGSVTGQTLVHQSRILVLAGVSYTYPAGGGFGTNENINYTDPPLSASMGNQQTVLAAEEPYGYGAGGSISAGELFLVKRRGGGLIVTGDLVEPSVTVLPGVQSTGTLYGNGASTPVGFVYCSWDNGAWVWNGSNTSQKMSSNLDDGFFLPPEFGTTFASNNYGFYVNSYGDKVYFSNNWMFDTKNNSWWTYYPRPNQGGTNLFWVQPVNGNYIYAATLSIVNNGAFLYRFDPTVASQNYQWQSLPLKLTAPDHVSDIREIVVRASNSSGGSVLTLSVLDQGSVVWGPDTMSGNVGAGPQLVRFNVAAIGVREPQVFLQVAGSGDMPVIHGIDIRYTTRARQAVTN